MVNSITGGLIAFFTGAALATVSIVGVVSSQSSTPERSPVNSQQPFVDYGSTQ